MTDPPLRPGGQHRLCPNPEQEIQVCAFRRAFLV
jgi:hypothetical protein